MNSYNTISEPSEYKAYNEGYKQGRADAIEEFVEKLKEYVENNGTIPNHFNIDKISEQLKE